MRGATRYLSAVPPRLHLRVDTLGCSGRPRTSSSGIVSPGSRGEAHLSCLTCLLPTSYMLVPLCFVSRPGGGLPSTHSSTHPRPAPRGAWQQNLWCGRVRDKSLVQSTSYNGFRSDNPRCASPTPGPPTVVAGSRFLVACRKIDGYASGSPRLQRHLLASLHPHRTSEKDLKRPSPETYGHARWGYRSILHILPALSATSSSADARPPSSPVPCRQAPESTQCRPCVA